VSHDTSQDMKQVYSTNLEHHMVSEKKFCWVRSWSHKMTAWLVCSHLQSTVKCSNTMLVVLTASQEQPQCSGGMPWTSTYVENDAPLVVVELLLTLLATVTTTAHVHHFLVAVGLRTRLHIKTSNHSCITDQWVCLNMKSTQFSVKVMAD